MEFITDNAALKFLVDILISIANFILNLIFYPINLIVKNFLPTIDNLFSIVANVFEIGNTYINWILDLLLIPSTAINIAILYWVFALSIGWLVFVSKTAITWIIRILAIRFIAK